MHSTVAIALLAVAPLVLGHAIEVVKYEEIQIRQVTSIPSAAPTIPGSAQTTDYNAILSDCLPPSSLLTVPTDTITPPAGLESYILTLTDPCEIVTGLPASISSELSSYTSAVVSWYSANKPAFSSQEVAFSSFEASARSNSICSPYYSLYSTASTTGLGVCTAVKSSGKGGASTTATGSTSSSSSGSSSSSNSAATSTSQNSASGNRGATFETTLILGSFWASCLVAVALL